jgi:WD40 repeat protein
MTPSSPGVADASRASPHMMVVNDSSNRGRNGSAGLGPRPSSWSPGDRNGGRNFMPLAPPLPFSNQHSAVLGSAEGSILQSSEDSLPAPPRAISTGYVPTGAENNPSLATLGGDTHSPCVVQELTAHKQEVCGLKWSFDERMLASGGNDNKLYVWTPQQGGRRDPEPTCR